MKHTRTKLARMAAAIDSPEGRIYFAGDSANWGVGAAMVHVSHVTTVLLAAATACAQSSDRLPVTDAQKIAIAFVHKVLHE